jgi:very-short-patch-repair endonuclease
VQEYYDRFLKKSDEGVCKNCKNPSAFVHITTGYRKYCCRRCQNTCLEFRANHSQKMKGKSMLNKEQLFSEEVCLKRAKSLTGRHLSDEHKRHIKEGNKGKHLKFHMPNCFATIGTHEAIFLRHLEELLGFRIIRQKKVLKYFLDGYIENLNVVVEFDEKYHFESREAISYTQKKMDRIVGQLNCKYIRVKDSEWIRNPRSVELQTAFLILMYKGADDARAA